MLPVKTVAFTNAAGSLAQAAARVGRHSFAKSKLRLVGIGPDRPSMAATVFDDTLFQPSHYNEHDGADISWLSATCKAAAIDLLIPCTDYEAFAFAANSASLPALVVSSADATQIFNDKWATYEAFSSKGIPFAPSFLPSQYVSSQTRIVAKPRFGGLSVGFIDNPREPQRYPDDFVIQEWLSEPEITLAFYVCRDGRIVGPIVLERILQYGMTFACVLTEKWNGQALNLARLICADFGIKGPCNVQCRFNGKGELIPFEVNCRFSGTCGMRALLGFPDVSYALREYLFDLPVPEPSLAKGGVMRAITEVFFRGAESMNDLKGTEFLPTIFL